MASLDRLTPARRLRLEKLLAIPDLASKSLRQASEELHVSRDVIVDDIRLLKNRGEIPQSFKFLSGKLARAIATRRARRAQLIRLYAEGHSMVKIAEELGVNSQTISHDLNFWRDGEDPGLARAEKLRHTQTRLTAEEARRRRVAEHRDEITELEASIGMSIEDLSFLNLVDQYKDELVGLLRGRKIDPLDKKTLSRFKVLEANTNRGFSRLGLTARAKVALWDLGIKNPAPIQFKPSTGWTAQRSP